MSAKDQLVDELSKKLLECQRKLIELRQLAEKSEERRGVETIDNLLALGLQMGMYVTALSDPAFNDESAVGEVREYCDLVEEIHTKTNKD